MVVKQGRARGRPPATGNDPQRTRRSLLDAAAELIAERGYRGTSVNQIVARAELSKGTFYWHFDSKDDALVAVLEDRVDQPVHELSELLASAPAERDMAPEASRRLLELLDRSREAILLEQEYQLLAIREPRLRAGYLRRQGALRDALAAGLDGRARQLGAPAFSTPSRDIAAAYLALASGLGAQKLIDPGAVPDELLSDVVALVYQGLVARAERGG
jgi:TetR/AcrR family transcriptional regulator, acrAB operon repressor